MADTPDYGKWIRDSIEANPRLSKAGLSRHLGHGLDRSRVLKMIDGRRRIQIDEIQAIADYMGVPPPKLALVTHSQESPVLPLIGIVQPGVWHEARAHRNHPIRSARRVPPSPDPRYPPGQQVCYEMGCDCPPANLLAGDGLIAVPTRTDKARPAPGTLLVMERMRDDLRQITLARSESGARDGIGLKPLFPGDGPSRPVAIVIAVFRATI